MQRLGGKNNEMAEHGLHCPYALTLHSPTQCFHAYRFLRKRVEWSSKPIKLRKNDHCGQIPVDFLSRERDAGCTCRDGGGRDACTALHLT